MRHALGCIGLLAVFAFVGVAVSTHLPSISFPPAPTARADSLRPRLNGVWDVRDPPLELAIDLDAGQVVVRHKGLAIKQTWLLVLDREDGGTVYLRGPVTSGGGAVALRFLSDDVVEWRGTRSNGVDGDTKSMLTVDSTRGSSRLRPGRRPPSCERRASTSNSAERMHRRRSIHGDRPILWRCIAMRM